MFVDKPPGWGTSATAAWRDQDSKEKISLWFWNHKLALVQFSAWIHKTWVV